MKRFSFIVSLVCSLAGCSAINGPNELPKYQGLSREAVVGRLGQPDRDEKFRMADAGLGEFRIELQNTYPLSKPENAAVLIEEMTWKDGDYWITLWLHHVGSEWVVLDSLRWHRNTAF